MAAMSELARLVEIWDSEAEKTVRLLESLPPDQYDFRPDPEGRSLGELAWHLAEVEHYWSGRVERELLGTETKVDLTRPRVIGALAPGYERVHAVAVTRVLPLEPAHLDRRLQVLGEEASVRDQLWSGTLFHLIHHRAQLVLLSRLAGGAPPGLYGPNREAMARWRAAEGAAPASKARR